MKNLQGRDLGEPMYRSGGGGFDCDRRVLSQLPRSHRLVLWPFLTNIIPPTPQSLDNLGKDSCGKWHTEED